MMNERNKGAEQTLTTPLWPGLSVRSGGFAVTCSSHGWCRLGFMPHGRRAPSTSPAWSPCITRAQAAQTHWCKWEPGMETTSHGMCTPGEWDGQEKPTDLYRQELPVAPYGRLAGGDLGDTTSCDAFKQPFYIVKKSMAPASVTSSTTQPPGTTLTPLSAHLAE